MRGIDSEAMKRVAVVGLLLWAGCGVIPGRRSALTARPAGSAPAATAPAAAPAEPERRSLYVGSFDERDAALELATSHGFAELTLYGLGAALRNQQEALATFLETAHARGLDVVAPISAMDRVEDLTRWEREHPNARFTGWVTEFEFWNAPPAERAARFAELQQILTAMRAQKGDGWIACYLGYPTAEEGAWIAEHVDRVYLSFAIADPADAMSWGEGTRSHRARHGYFAGRLPIWPIVYARGDAHMRPWLQQHSVSELETTLRRNLNGQMHGVGYFDFASMRDVF
ncbi:MAG: hypothetical protein H6719_27675 [Sandaracinaceae bacterium]|nr:hypothetical protein [Sandaracinaceae bacterium]